MGGCYDWCFEQLLDMIRKVLLTGLLSWCPSDSPSCWTNLLLFTPVGKPQCVPHAKSKQISDRICKKEQMTNWLQQWLILFCDCDLRGYFFLCLEKRFSYSRRHTKCFLNFYLTLILPFSCHTPVFLTLSIGKYAPCQKWQRSNARSRTPNQEDQLRQKGKKHAGK